MGGGGKAKPSPILNRLRDEGCRKCDNLRRRPLSSGNGEHRFNRKERREHKSLMDTRKPASIKPAIKGQKENNCSRAMNISDAQRENRVRFHGGFYGQLVSGVLWLLSAGLADTVGVKSAIIALVFGGFMIFPATELLVRLSGMKKLSEANTLWSLGMQVAFVLPFSMLLLVPVTRYRTNLFYPAMMILLGAHYIPFVFLYGMRLFAFLAAILIGGGVCIAMYGANRFSTGAWGTGVVLVVFAFLGRKLARQDASARP
jgi:hypothetical protein